MRSMKKVASLALALVLCLSLSVGVWAAQEGTLNGGSITIDHAVAGQTYNAYQILYLESYNATSGAYVYKANSAWATWLKSQTTYVKIDDQGYVSWVTNLTCNNVDEDHTHNEACYTQADVVAFAKAAREYATTIAEDKETANVAPDATATATTTTVSFTNLKLGYYLVDSTLGTLCSLDTTNLNVAIKEKNAVPTNEKKVQEDSKVSETGNGWGASNDADMKQVVNFQSTITAQAGAENYVFHDKMSTGLTFGSVTGITLNNTAVDAKYYTVTTANLTDNCTFEVVFTQDFCNTLKANDQIVISYTATLNENAVVGLPGNPNESKLSYGDSGNTKYTTASETKTYTWDVDVLKYANGNKNSVLEGVKFVLLKKVDKVDHFAVVDANGKLTGWTTDGVAPKENPNESKTYATVLTTNSNGKIEIDGLDADTYYLREIETLPGFNVLSGDQDFTITGATTPEDGNTPTYSTIMVEVENKSGTELPETGGTGTTIFYVVGGMLAVLAAVLLITRKRMGAEN